MSRCHCNVSAIKNSSPVRKKQSLSSSWWRAFVIWRGCHHRVGGNASDCEFSDLLHSTRDFLSSSRCSLFQSPSNNCEEITIKQLFFFFFFFFTKKKPIYLYVIRRVSTIYNNNKFQIENKFKIPAALVGKLVLNPHSKGNSDMFENSFAFLGETTMTRLLYASPAVEQEILIMHMFTSLLLNMLIRITYVYCLARERDSNESRLKMKSEK